MNSPTESPAEAQDNPDNQPQIDFIEGALKVEAPADDEADDQDEDTARLKRIQDADEKPNVLERARTKKQHLKEKADEKRDNAVRFARAYRAPVLIIACALILVAGIVSYIIFSNQALREGATIEAFNFVFFFSVIGSLLTVLFYWQLSHDSLRDRSELADNEIVIAHSRQHWMCLAAYVLLFGITVYGVIFAKIYHESPSFFGLVILMTVGILLLSVWPHLIRLYMLFRDLENTQYLKWGGLIIGGLVVIGVALEANQLLDDVGRSTVRFFSGLPPLFLATPSRPMEIVSGFAFIALVWRFMTYRVNPIVATDTRLVAPNGLLRRRNPSMGLDKITDQDSARNLKLPWVTLKLESAGQNQAITKLRFVPRKFLRQIKQPKQEL